MEKEGLITKSGLINTEFVGRKASAYSIIADYRVSIGVEIVKKEVKIIAVDLVKRLAAQHVILLMNTKSHILKLSVIKFLNLKMNLI